jgi:hypothetical protein
VDVVGYRDNTTYSNGKMIRGLYQIDQSHFNAVIIGGNSVIFMKADLSKMNVAYN